MATTQSSAEQALFDLLTEGLSSGSVIEIVVGDRRVPVPATVAGRILVDLDGPDALPDVLTTGQAADLLDVSRPTIVALIDRGDLPATRVGNRRRILAADVLAYKRRVTSGGTLSDVVAVSEELGLYER